MDIYFKIKIIRLMKSKKSRIEEVDIYSKEKIYTWLLKLDDIKNLILEFE
jgi:hypothetical protein